METKDCNAGTKYNFEAIKIFRNKEIIIIWVDEVLHRVSEIIF